MLNKFMLTPIIISMTILSIPCMGQSPLIPENPRVEYLKNPIGIDTSIPRFSWVLPAKGYNVEQKAYQIQVSKSLDALLQDKPDVWDSGTVESAENVHIEYAGPSLESFTRYFWRVRVTYQNNETTRYSEPTYFETAFLNPQKEMSAKWIRHQEKDEEPVKDDKKEEWERKRISPMLRKTFEITKPIKEARAYVSGLGYVELHINGQKVGDHLLDPAYTVFEKRTLYVTHDVTNLLKQGKNAVGMMLGHGWWKKTCGGWLELRVLCEDGSVEKIITDESWKTSTGPIVKESLYHGETYDARLEKVGWDTPDYDDSGWTQAVLFEHVPEKLVAQVMPPIQIVQRIKPVSITQRKDGGPDKNEEVYMVDFGQNMTGVIKMKVQGPAGTKVRIRHAELLYEDGRLNVENIRKAKVTDEYILKGEGEEEYMPRFTQHGYRYAEVTGYPGELTPDKIEAQVFHTNFARSGHFECDNPLINNIRDIVLWAIRGNNMSIPTDCPQRDERMGWMGDAHLASEATIMNFDVAAYYQKWLWDIADSQSPEGYVPDTCPANIWGDKKGSPPWAIAYPLITWYSWRYYQNRRVVEFHYDNLVRWFKSMEKDEKDGVMEYCHYGDWVALEKSPMEPIGTGCYYWTAVVLEELAGVLGKQDDVDYFKAKKQKVAEAFNAKYFDKEKGYYRYGEEKGTPFEGTQFQQIFPLYLGIAQGEYKEMALKKLREEIEVKRNGHLYCGILGAKYVYDVLTDNNMVDLAYKVVLQKDFPSYGYMIELGATTLWELWEYKTGPEMNSHNHQMFGSVVDWFFGGIAGIRRLPQPGYKYITIAPKPWEGPINYAQAYIDTVRGRVLSRWDKNSDGSLSLTVVIPPNSKAKVIVPKKENMSISAKPEVTSVSSEPLQEIFELGSGTYQFLVK
ncbi:MAG TPA: family 78 glycoside hydrolase catalytic domain [Candidatus Hydrogenedens sp.]|nr:family 78 glycoside hydrolase catalytic domain [Candidatus Hydrogenedens sp.]